MNKLKILISVSIFAFIWNDSYSASFSGKVKNINDSPIASVNVFLVENPKIGTATNIDGEFTFPDLPIGINQIKFTCLGRCPETLEIFIQSEKDSIFREIILDDGLYINCDTCYQNYKSNLKTILSNNSTEIKFNLKKCWISENNLYCQLIVKNESSLPIYVPKYFRCLSVYKPILFDEENNVLKSNVVDMGCDVLPMKFIYEEIDIIEIQPKAKKSLDPIKVWQYDLKSLKDGYGTLKLKFSYNFDINKKLNNCLNGKYNFTSDELGEIRSIYCKLLNGPIETNTILIKI